MMNCSKYLPERLTKEVPEPPVETYYVANMVRNKTLSVSVTAFVILRAEIYPSSIL